MPECTFGMKLTSYVDALFMGYSQDRVSALFPPRRVGLNLVIKKMCVMFHRI